MEEIFNVVKTIKERIKKYEELLRANEALTRYVLIDPLLRALGWDTENPEIVRPEERQEGGKPDYILYHNGKKLIAIEAKKLGREFDENKTKDLGFKYSWRNQIPYFIITDGRIWEIYDVEKIGGRLILKVDIGQEPEEDVVRKLLVLWKPLIKNKLIPLPLMETTKFFPKKEDFKSDQEKNIFIGPINSNSAKKLVLYVLYKKGIPLKRKEIVEEVKKIVKLTKYDKEVLQSGYERWETMIRWAITKLHQSGLLDGVGGHKWKINDKGIEKLKRHFQI